MTQTVSLKKNPYYIPELESLRGWAILLVVVFHCFGLLYSNSHLGLGDNSALVVRLIAAGNTGVTLFFVLSGFLLALPFLRDHRNGQTTKLSEFYLNRVIRIIPVYYLAVLVAWIVTSNTTATLSAMVFIPVGFDMFPFSVPWWSLSTEMQFYLLLPWVMLALTTKIGRVVMSVLTLIWLAWYLHFAVESQWLSKWYSASVFGRGSAFMVGGIFAYLYLNNGLQKIERVRYLVGILFFLAVTSLVVLLQWFGLKGEYKAMAEFPFYHDLEGFLWGTLLFMSLSKAAPLKPVFINKFFSHIGRISYSLYLVHLPILFYLLFPIRDSQKNAVPMVILSFLLSWLLAFFCYTYIEKPFLKLKPKNRVKR